MKKIIAIVGANGKMGKEICKKLQKKFKIIKIDLNNSLEEAKNSNLIIDFASANSSVETAKFCSKNKIKLIIGSTGQTDFQIKEIEEASNQTPILISSNFSLGIFIQKKISELILSLTNSQISIFEKHHSEKKDIPSGTAILISNHIQSLTGTKPTILSERGGREIGTHKIDFYFGDELLSVTHQAFSRECFACGVVKAVEFMLLVSDSRLYSFDEVLDSLMKN